MLHSFPILANFVARIKNRIYGRSHVKYAAKSVRLVAVADKISVSKVWEMIKKVMGDTEFMILAYCYWVHFV